MLVSVLEDEHAAPLGKRRSRSAVHGLCERKVSLPQDEIDGALNQIWRDAWSRLLPKNVASYEVSLSIVCTQVLPAHEVNLRSCYAGYNKVEVYQH